MNKPNADTTTTAPRLSLWYWGAAIISIFINRQLGQAAAFKGALMALAKAHIAETAEMPDGTTAYVSALSNVPGWTTPPIIVGAIVALLTASLVGSSSRRGWLAAIVGIVVGCLAGTLVGFLEGYFWHP